MVSRETNKTAHGALMLWAWGVLVPAVVLLGTVGRDLFPAGLWFYLHRAMGVAAAVCTIAGIVLAKQIGTGVEKARTHRILGYALFCVGLAQPVIAYFRPDPSTDPALRDVWHFVHEKLGYASVAVGLYNVRLGLQMWDPKDALSITYSVGLVAAGAVVVAWQVAGRM
eukprot:m.46651 g.46651  ORF g.46651 m.46651 type:complete len:168 (-) comp15471_c0_seq1:159-662(-)